MADVPQSWRETPAKASIVEFIGAITDPVDMAADWSAIFSAVCDAGASNGRSASTANSYDRMIRLYVEPTIGGVPLASVDGSMLNALYARLLTEGRTETRRGLGPGLSPKTVRNMHGMLTKAFRDAVRWGADHRNPCDAADPPRGKHRR